MKPRHLFALLLFVLTALAPPARAQTPVEGAPKLIDYQGTALDSTGAPLAPPTINPSPNPPTPAPKNYTMKFRLYAAQAGGNPIWSESQTVTVSNGQFSVRLGQGISIAAEPRPDLSTVFTGKDRFLGLTIVISGPEAEITPRLAFLSAPFSFVAERSKTADSVLQASGNSILGTTTIANLTLAGPSQISGSNVIEFGGGIAGKDPNAGKIGYGALTTDSLDIVGAGTTGSNRKVKVFAEGGLTVAGTVTADGFAGSGAGLTNLNGANLNPGSVDATKLIAAVQQALCPPGSIMAYGGTVAPTGWFMCDGTSYPRATYPALFSAIGTAFGASGGGSAFNVPDFRGKFLRGRDGGPNFDPDRSNRTALYAGGNGGDNVGSFEGQSVQSHTHGYKDVYISEVQGQAGVADYYLNDQGVVSTNLLGISGHDYDNSGYQLSRTTAATGGNETRPVNITVNYIIKN